MTSSSYSSSSAGVTESSQYLIFTTRQSEELFLTEDQDQDESSSSSQQQQRSSIFEGVYTCQFDTVTGKCNSNSTISSSIVTDSFGMTEHSHIPHRGIDVMNLQLIVQQEQQEQQQRVSLYAGYYSGKRNSFEILRAQSTITASSTPPPTNSKTNTNDNNDKQTNNVIDSPMNFVSFFRSQNSVWNSPDADNPFLCSDDDEIDGGSTYLKVHPRDFVVDEKTNDVYISWDGFYQNCTQHSITTTTTTSSSSKQPPSPQKRLVWTVGISKLIQSSDCILTSTDEEVKFEDCTEVVAIAYQDSTAYETVLGYAGLTSSKLPNGDNLFFLSALDHVNLDPNHDGSKTRLYNELWVIKEGLSYADNPKHRQVFGRVEIDRAFIDVPCDDVGSIKLRIDPKSGTPTGICRSAYDAGIFCNSISVSEEGSVEILQSNTFATKEQIAETCNVYKSKHYPHTQDLTAVSTGIAPLWKDDSPDHEPYLITYGCYGEMNYHGNMTTIFNDGRIVQTANGAYPGSVLFGPNLHYEEEHIDATNVLSPNGLSSSSSIPNELSSGTKPISFAIMLVLLVGVIAIASFVASRKQMNNHRRRRWNTVVRYRGVHNGFLGNEMEMEIDDDNGNDNMDGSISVRRSNVQYVELATTTTTSPTHHAGETSVV